ncbi:MAG: CocE/NonD family hydrolase, partial [Janthinobacterium sp.]
MRVSSPVRLTGLALVVSSLFISPAMAQTPPMTPDIGAKLVMPDVNDYVKRVVMIPMRDGVKLYTVIIVPKDAKRAPIMLTRTPYNAARRAQRVASPSMLATLPQGDDTLVENGYIRVFQDVRGKHGSEGD